jgi:hypothetical protein
MTILNIRTAVLTLALASVAGCDAEDFGAGDVSLRPGGNGILFNTSWIGTFDFGEFHDEFSTLHNDTMLQGVTVTSEYKGNYYSIPLQSVWAEDGQIFGKGDGQTFSGHQFDESVWSFQMLIDGDKVDVTVKIKSVTDDGGKNWKYVFKHNYNATDANGNCLVSQSKEAKKGEESDGEGDDQECLIPVCQDDPDMIGEQYEAIVTEDITVDTVTGVIEKSAKPAMYWGCVSGAVGKAGNWGYRLEHLDHEHSMFEAAVRMVRADYCGTGDSFTTPGQQVTLTDIFGYNHLAQSYKTEAIWDPKGAACVYQPRLAAEWPDALSVIKMCEQLGAPRIPKECLYGDDLSTYADALYWSANPS